MSLVSSAVGRRPRCIRYTFAICTLITVCWVPVRVVMLYREQQSKQQRTKYVREDILPHDEIEYVHWAFETRRPDPKLGRLPELHQY